MKNKIELLEKLVKKITETPDDIIERAIDRLGEKLIMEQFSYSSSIDCIEKEDFFKDLDDFENIVETREIKIEDSLSEKDINLINEGKEEKEWMEELALAA